MEFQNNGRKTFYATYTAYSGRGIRSELLETADFRSFRMTPLSGTATRNKGMASVPSQDQRPLCDDRAAGQRKPLSDLLR